MKTSILSSDYKSAIIEGEKILATQQNSPGLAELYYLLGVSYLKDGNYLRASDIFEIILKEFKGSSFQDEALLGLGDSYFLREDYARAKKYYHDLLNENAQSKFVELVYTRLGECELKAGAMQQAKNYLEKVKGSDALALENAATTNSCSVFSDYYTIQVGSFSRRLNALHLVEKLVKKGYAAFIVESASGSQKIFRVRVGKLTSRQEAAELQSKLSLEGYPTKLCP